MLTIIKEVEPFVQPSGQKARSFLCVCDCGKEKRVRLSHLRHHRVKSCGCAVGEMHGGSGGTLYTSWRAMKMRCNWKGYSQAHLYSERGISVCREWASSFSAFRDWSMKNGYAPGLTIDRKKNSEGYTPENCRWVTQMENCNNRRNTFMVTYQGEDVSFSLLLHRLNLHDHASAIRTRIGRGWSADAAIDTPLRQGNYHRGRHP